MYINMELQLTASQLKEVSTVGVSTLVSTVTIHYIPFFFESHIFRKKLVDILRIRPATNGADG